MGDQEKLTPITSTRLIDEIYETGIKNGARWKTARRRRWWIYVILCQKRISQKDQEALTRKCLFHLILRILDQK